MAASLSLKRDSPREGSKPIRKGIIRSLSPSSKNRIVYILEYQFFNGTYQDPLGTRPFEFFDDLPKGILGDHRVYGTPPRFGQGKDRGASHAGKDRDDLFQFFVRGVQQNIFVGPGL